MRHAILHASTTYTLVTLAATVSLVGLALPVAGAAMLGFIVGYGTGVALEVAQGFDLLRDTPFAGKATRADWLGDLGGALLGVAVFLILTL